ncbi:MAG: ion transporter, partial [Hymenobacteraceae bacterium]|nr:ion transporter [Hymenobacteraceae bacterium]MDX5395301.1 ion transporter [Hymenobacteraceae bacterium]MDX5511337.1 ion transporter [Hymenobacteraceae bacterium]
MTALSEEERIRRKRLKIFFSLEAFLEAPMFILSVLWLSFLVIELLAGLTDTQQDIVLIIWGLFIAEFVIKLIVAPQKWLYLKQNWLTIVALLIPALRVFRLLQALRVLQVSRVATTTYFVRALTSGKRFLAELKEAQGPTPEPEMHVGVMLAYSKAANLAELERFANQLAQDVVPEMEAATGIKWIFHLTDPVALESDDPRTASLFLDDASLRMAEGPFDLITVITDVALLSRKNRAEAGLASRVCRVTIMSVRKLIRSERG